MTEHKPFQFDMQCIEPMCSNCQINLRLLGEAHQQAEAELTAMHGRKFSERVYYALKSRAETAEAENKNLKDELDHFLLTRQQLRAEVERLRSLLRDIELTTRTLPIGQTPVDLILNIRRIMNEHFIGCGEGKAQAALEEKTHGD